MRPRMLVFILVLLMVPLSCSLGSRGENGVPEPALVGEALISAGQGGAVVLEDGARLTVPAGALAADEAVSIRAVETGVPPEGYTVSLGKVYEVSLGEAGLKKAVVISLPVEPDLLPEGMTKEDVFLSYWDEARQDWVYAGGVYDGASGKISLPVMHATLWKPAVWNGVAWMAVLDESLKGKVLELVQSSAQLVEECPQAGVVTRVESQQTRMFLQGCVRVDDPLKPEFTIINLKSFYLEISRVSGGGGYPEAALLGPGERLDFTANSSDPSPVTMQAVITPRSAAYLLGQLVLNMMPGFSYLPNQEDITACLTENLALVEQFSKAAEVLSYEQDAGRAAQAVAELLIDTDARARLLRTAQTCGAQAAASWKGVADLLGSSTGTIQAATGVWASYLASKGESEILFHWNAAAASESTSGSPTPRAAVDLKDPGAVLAWFLKAIERNSFSGIETFLDPESFFMTNNPIEGGQDYAVDEFKVDLHLRAANSKELACRGVSFSQGYLQVWTEGWSPRWEMTEMCYDTCVPFTSPLQTTNAVFSFVKNRNDQYLLRHMALFDGSVKEWDPAGLFPVYACDPDIIDRVISGPTLTCSGSLVPRLVVGGYAYVNENPPVPNRVRANPGLEEKLVGQIDPGKVMQVTGGPVCASGMTWWEVVETTRGLKGWTVEADLKSYWLIPCPSEEFCSQ